MNEMAMVEYLLKKYSFLAERCKEWQYPHAWAQYINIEYHKGKRDQLKEIIQERFGMQIEETDTEYRAYNRICSVRVLK